MRNRAWFYAAAIGIAAIAALFFVNIVAVMNRPSDEQQIRAAIEEMRIASIEGRPGGVQQYLSDSFELPEDAPQEGGLFSGPKSKVADAIRKSKVDKLEITNIRVTIDGTNAIATCDVSADFQYMMLPPIAYSAKDIQIEFRKETKRRLFLIPDPQWLVLRFSNVTFSDLNI